MFYQTFKVVGHGEFPMDMLRYDSCFPQSEQDSGKILGTTWANRENNDRVEVGIARYVPYKGTEVTRARWESFGWTVIGEVEERKV